MNAERFRRAAEMFEAARGLPPAERRRILDPAGGDAALVREVLDLLAAHDDLAGPFAEGPDAPTRAVPDTAAEEPADWREGDRIGPYRLRARLGRGGMGTVFRASVEEEVGGLPRGAEVALKVLHPGLLAVPGSLDRFRREASIGLRVRHPNVVRTLAVGSATACGTTAHFLAMEFVPGRTLLQVLRELGRAPEALCRHVGREIAKGLAAVHAAGAVHRDVKPENVLLTPDGTVRLMDLGIALVGGDETRLTLPRSFVGSLLYAAPEQFPSSGGPVDARSDLYSLGLVLYELATGVHPFRSAPYGAGTPRGEPRPAAEVHPEVSPFLEDLIRSLLAPEPGARPPSAQAVAETLELGESSAWWRDRVRVIRETTRRPLRRMRVPHETALHGRGAETAALHRAFERAAASEGHVVLVRGEAGIGKSRLVEDFVADLTRAADPPHVLLGGHAPGGAATATSALVEAFRDHFADEDLHATLVRSLGPALARPFASLLRGEPAPAGVAPLSDDSLPTAFVRAAHALADERPTVVVVDDLHFAPAEGLALFASLAAAIPGRRLLLVGTARRSIPERWVAEIERLPHVQSLRLERLGPESLRRILEETLGDEAPVEDLLPRVAERSDGNPYFAFEILRGLRGRATTGGGVRSAASALRGMEIPSTIADMIRARLAALGADERALLDVAACQGFEFDPSLVATVLRRDRIGALQGLANAERTHRLVRSQGRRVAFDHHQVQETLYADLPGPLRTAYHAALGEALVERAAGTGPREAVPGAEAVEICRHLLLGERGTSAAVWVRPALRHLGATHRNEAVADLARAAVERGAAATPAERIDLLLDRTEALTPLGRSEEEGATVREATRLADAHGDPRLLSRCRERLGWHLWALGRWDEATQAFADGVEFARRSGDRRLEAVAIGHLGSMGNETGDFEGALTACRQQLALALELGQPSLQASAIGNLVLSLQYLGRYGEAHAENVRLLDLTRASGKPLWIALTLVNLGRLSALLGDPATGRAELSEALDRLREDPERRVEAYVIHRLGLVAEQTGDPEQAAPSFRRALALRREIRYSAGIAESLVALGRHRLGRGETDAARVHLDEARAVALGIGSAGDLVLAECLAALLPGGDAARAAEALSARESRMRAGDRLEAHFLLWRADGDGTQLDEAKRRLARLVESAPPGRREAMVRNVPLHRDVAAASAVP